ncbi:MAG: hypothetical protein AAGD05_13620, partial [Bacteroidota bacterium]
VAEVLIELDNYLSSTVTFLSLSEMMTAMDEDVNAVFSGSPLVHGFLPDSALLPMKETLKSVDLIPVVLKVPDVLMVASLQMRTTAQEAQILVENQGTKRAGTNQGQWHQQIQIPRTQRPILAPLVQQVLSIQKGTTPCTVNLDQLAFEFKKLQGKKRVAKLAPQARDLPIPTGRFRDLNRYYSIQQEFPKIYGLDPHGPAPDATYEQLAKIKQLKAYLLLFDQIMANYLAQLAGLAQLFSWNKTIHRTYFFQGLENAVVHLGELLVDGPLDLTTSNEPEDQQILYQALAVYEQKLAHFREDEMTFLSRRNRFLDHLLARFGRSLLDYTESINQQALEEQQRVAMATKLRILEQYETLSATRGRAYDPTQAFEFKEEFSGLRRWVETLFDMRQESKTVYHFNQRFVQETYLPDGKNQQAFSKYVLTTKDGSPLDLAEVMRIGTDKDNYWVEHIPDKGHQIFLYKIIDPTRPVKIYQLTECYEQAEETLEVIDDLAHLIGGYNQTSERVYLVEHLLLRPTPIERYFGLALLDKQGQAWMQTTTWYPKTLLESLLTPPDTKTQFYYCIKGISDCEQKVSDASPTTTEKSPPKVRKAKYQFSIKALPKTDAFTRYQVQLKIGELGNIIQMRSTQQYESKAIAQKAIEQWMKNLQKYFKAQQNHQVRPRPWKTLLKPWLPIHKKLGKYQSFLTDPYSFILTAVLPKWPSRFQEKGLKKALEQAIQRECPAH